MVQSYDKKVVKVWLVDVAVPIQQVAVTRKGGAAIARLADVSPFLADRHHI
jgi:hypothetical protein